MTIAKPEWRTEPQKVSVRVDVEQVKRSPLGNEVIIYQDMGGDKKSAVIPSKAFDEESGTVVAAIVGDIGESVLLSFPTSSAGTSTWVVPKDLIQNYIVNK